MNHVVTTMLAVCLLLTGCDAATVTGEPTDVVAVVEKSGDSKPNPPDIFPEPKVFQAEAPMAVAPIAQRAEVNGDDREFIAKALPGEGISQIKIYAELCAVVLEKSTGDEIEAVFSFPEITAPNYNKHFDLGLTRNGSIASISTDYENQRWDTSFEPISGFDSDGYREKAILTVRLPERQYSKVSLHLVTAGATLDISGVDASTVEMRIGTGDVIIQTDRAYKNLSISHVVGNVTLCAPELGDQLHISSKIGVFTLSLPSEPANFLLEIRYDEDAVKAGDEAIYVLPASWNAAVTGHTVHCARGDTTKSILVDNQRYGVFAVVIDGTATGEPASAR